MYMCIHVHACFMYILICICVYVFSYVIPKTTLGWPPTTYSDDIIPDAYSTRRFKRDIFFFEDLYVIKL